jgi:hypothetical protein
VSCRQQLNLRVAGHQPLALLEQLAGVPGGGRHRRYPDFGSPVQVKVTRFGDRDPRVAAAQLGDQRLDDGPLLFQRADVAKQHVKG